jgi:protein TonB
MPSYPGGNRALMEWIRKNVVYPDETCAQGRVIVGFVVERDGSVTNVEVIRGTSPELDRAAVEVVSRMPKWIPGKQKGQAVRCSYNVPVSFQNY